MSQKCDAADAENNSYCPKRYKKQTEKAFLSTESVQTGSAGNDQHPAFNKPMNTAIQSNPLTKKNKKPITPNLRRYVFQLRFSMFRPFFFPFGRYLFQNGKRCIYLRTPVQKIMNAHDMRNFFFIFAILLVFAGLLSPACKHEPMFTSPDPDPDPTDTIPTDPGNTGGGQGVTCNPDTVYFTNAILPLLVSNCSLSGCHDETSKAEGIVLTSYTQVVNTVNGVRNTNWSLNELMDVITEDRIDKRMPPSPRPALSQTQIDLIGKWLAQGAKNNGCNENAAGCNTNNATYKLFVKPLIDAQCFGCHSGAAPQGGISLANYAAVKAAATNGKLYASVTRSANRMPKNGQKLDDCTTQKLKAWIDKGALEN